MIEQKLIGTTLITTAEFKDVDNKKMIPALVSFNYKKPDDTISKEVVTANSTGNFVYSVKLDVAGEWNFRWESQSGNTTAQEFDIMVLDTKVK